MRRSTSWWVPGRHFQETDRALIGAHPVPLRGRQIHPAGCHHLADPDEEYIKYTRVTDQALFYKEEDSLVHKILAIEEAEGMGGAAYSIRTIQSAKKITVAATGKDANGRMKTEEYTVNGPVCVMITTTPPRSTRRRPHALSF
ncbi:MAG: hypothetical protein JKP90_09745 [Desulfofustis sp. PB-SRB1]|nr:hypothetical protein [Desulfofustis sp. PB-SRB1]